MTDQVNHISTAIIGCGNIAHVHLSFLRKAGYNLDAVCDSSQVRGELFAKQYGIQKQFTSVEDLFAEVKPKIVHILTPPHTHHQLILLALKAGCNVFVEKPLCQCLSEYLEIDSLAKKLGLLVSVDHTRVYHPMIRAARSRISAGEFGRIVRMEYLYDDPSIIKAQNGSGYRWAKGAPAWFSKVRGGVLTDLLPHPISVFLSFDEDLKVKHVDARTLPNSVIEDLSVMMRSDGVDAQLTLSVNQKPLKNLFTVYCEKGSVQIDLRGMFTVYQADKRLPSILSRAVVSLSTAWQIARGFTTNVIKLLSGKAHTYDGLDEIIHNFYDMVRDGKSGEVPLINAGRVMGISQEIISSALDEHHVSAGQTETSVEYRVPHQAECLVLGGTGFIGKYVVKRLLDSGNSVRVLCRQTSSTATLPNDVDVVYGDLKDIDSIKTALVGVKTVIHCAAAMSGDWAEFYESTVQGTNNILSSIESSQVERLVYMSSLGVLNYNKLSNGDRVDESAPIEDRPSDRGFYTRAKVEAEENVKNFAVRNKGTSVIILRPGLVYGQESNNNLQNCGVLLGNYLLVFGFGRKTLGLNYVENLADAVVATLNTELQTGTIIHVTDTEQPSVKDIINEHNKLSKYKVCPIYIPILIWRLIFACVDFLLYFKSGKGGTFCYRFSSNSRRLEFNGSKSQRLLGWVPCLNFHNAFKVSYCFDRDAKDCHSKN